MVHQCARFSANPKLPHDQAVKCVLKYLKGMFNNILIMNTDPEKVIEYYLDAYFMGGWNQEEGRDPGLLLSRTRYIIVYANFPIVWASQLQV